MYMHVYARMCVQCSIDAKSALIDVTKGVGGVTPKQLYLFCKHINITNNYSKKYFIVHKHIL